MDLAGIVATIGLDQFKPSKAAAYLVQHQCRTVAILDASGADDNPQRQVFGIDQGVPLATFQFLAGVIPQRMVMMATFSADFSV